MVLSRLVNSATASFRHHKRGKSASPALPTRKVPHGRIHGTSLFLVQFRPYSIILNVQWRRLFYHLEYVNGFFHLFWRFPAARSRVVIRLAQGRKAKPNANTRTLRPDKCLVVPSLPPGLRPCCPRNTGDNAATTRAGFQPVSPLGVAFHFYCFTSRSASCLCPASYTRSYLFIIFLQIM